LFDVLHSKLRQVHVCQATLMLTSLDSLALTPRLRSKSQSLLVRNNIPSVVDIQLLSYPALKQTCRQTFLFLKMFLKNKNDANTEIIAISCMQCTTP